MAWLSAIPDLLTAAGFLLIWMHTDLTGSQWVANGAATMLLEFFVVHASGFFTVILYSGASRAKRSLYLAGLASFYLLMIAGYAFGMHAWWMLGAFFWLTLGRGIAIWTSSPKDDREQLQWVAMSSWAASVACYLGAVGASVTMEWPAYGVTPEVIQAAGFSGGGEWETQPYRALVAGALYFSIIGMLRPLIRMALLRKPAAAAHAQ